MGAAHLLGLAQPSSGQAGDLARLAIVAARAHGDDPAVAERQHQVVAVPGLPGARLVHAGRVDHHQHLLTAGGDLLDPRRQSLPGLAPQRPGQLVPAMARPGRRVRLAGVQEGPSGWAAP